MGVPQGQERLLSAGFDGRVALWEVAGAPTVKPHCLLAFQAGGLELAAPVTPGPLLPPLHVVPGRKPPPQQTTVASLRLGGPPRRGPAAVSARSPPGAGAGRLPAAATPRASLLPSSPRVLGGSGSLPTSPKPGKGVGDVVVVVVPAAAAMDAAATRQTSLPAGEGRLPNPTAAGRAADGAVDGGAQRPARLHVSQKEDGRGDGAWRLTSPASAGTAEQGRACPADASAGAIVRPPAARCGCWADESGSCALARQPRGSQQRGRHRRCSVFDGRLGRGSAAHASKPVDRMTTAVPAAARRHTRPQLPVCSVCCRGGPKRSWPWRTTLFEKPSSRAVVTAACGWGHGRRRQGSPAAGPPPHRTRRPPRRRCCSHEGGPCGAVPGTPATPPSRRLIPS